MAAGVWRTDDYVDDRIPASTARRWDPSADGIHLSADPVTVARVVAEVPDLSDLWPRDGIDPEAALIIADFGLGTDNPIVLDLSRRPAPVLTIDFAEHAAEPRSVPTWIEIAPDFDRFVDLLGPGLRSTPHPDEDG